MWPTFLTTRLLISEKRLHSWLPFAVCFKELAAPNPSPPKIHVACQDRSVSRDQPLRLQQDGIEMPLMRCGNDAKKNADPPRRPPQSGSQQKSADNERAKEKPHRIRGGAYSSRINCPKRARAQTRQSTSPSRRSSRNLRSMLLREIRSTGHLHQRRMTVQSQLRRR